MRERLRVGDFLYYQTSDELELDPPVPPELNVTPLADGRTQFYSTTSGVGADNAQDPESLTDGFLAYWV